MAKNDLIMFVCSEGGHYSQMLALNSLFKKYNSVMVTDNARAEKSSRDLEGLKEIFIVGGISKTRKNIVSKKGNDSRWAYFKGYISTFKQSLSIMKTVRPRIIISTGSYIAVPFFIIGKLMGVKLVYIETRAKVYCKSLTGILIGGISDKIIVQWPEMLEVYKNSEYYGTLI